jgi:hypothetical protein
MTRTRVTVLAGLIGLALLGFFQFPGHTWLQQDTQIWVPMFERIWDPTALQHDLVASKPHLSFTVYDETAMALRWITRASFHDVLKFEQIVFRILELLGVYLLALSFPLSPRMSMLVAAIFGLGATIVGPLVLTLEYEPVPRGFALGFLFLAVGLAAQGRLALAGTAAAIGFLFHAPTSVPICLLLVVIAIRRRTWKPLAPLVCACVILLIAARLQAGATEAQPFFERISPAWEHIERMRASYNWVSTWVNPLMWQYLLFWALSLVALWRIRPRCGRLFAIGLPLIGILSVAVSYLLTEIARWSMMPQMQPARAVLWVTALTVILCAAAGVSRAERGVWWESAMWFAAAFAVPLQSRILELSLLHLLLAIGLAVLTTLAVMLRQSRFAVPVFAAAVIAPYFVIPLVGHVRNYPNLHTPEIQTLAAFARSNTPKDAVFLFPDAAKALYPGLFRAEAIRSVYVDWKAGGQVNYFRSLAEDWWTRWQATMSGKDISTNLPRFRELGIDYIVMKKNDPLTGLSPVYDNSGYLVYRLIH